MPEELKSRLQDHQRAIEEHDRPVMEKLLDDEYMQQVLHPHSAEYSREMILQGFTAYQIRSYEIRNQRIDMDGDCATVLHRDTMTLEIGGNEQTGTYVFTDVWRLRGASWRLWRRHVTEVHLDDDCVS